MKNLATLLTLALLWCGLAPAALATCPTATNVQVTPVFGATTMTVEFTVASGVGRYVVHMYQGSARVATRYVGGGGAIFHLLQPATTYSVRVGSICSPGDTTYAAPVSATTPSGPAACPGITHYALSQVSGTQATLTFAPVSGAVSYTVWYWALNDSTNRYTLTVPSPPVQLSNLLPNTPYGVRVITNCGSGTSGSGLGTLFTFGTTANGSACSAAANVVVTATGSTTADVSFTPGSGNSGYRVAYYAAGSPTTYYASGAGSPITLTGLTPGQTYYIQLQSQCAGSGSTTVYTAGGYLPYGFRSTGALAARSQLGAGTVEAYPNPAHQAVTVQLPRVPGADRARLTLLNTLGQPVYTREVALAGDATRAELPLTGLPAGLYTLHVVAGSQAATQRLAIE